MNETQRLAAHCRERLDLTDARLAPEYSYRHLPLAVVDAVYSIGVNYASTRNTVERFADWAGIERFAEGAWPPPREDQLSLSEFLRRLEPYSADELAEEVFGNRQRTSTHPSAILKADAVRRFAEILKQLGVEYLQDVTRRRLGDEAERAIRALPGQTSGIGWRYFFMLAGEIEEVKPDRMIVRFVEEALQRSVTTSEARKLMLAACQELRGEHPDLHARQLDYLAWQYQRAAPDEADVPKESGGRGRVSTITDEQARSYLFEVLREAEILDDCRRRFEKAAGRWLEAVRRSDEPTGESLLREATAERDMLAALEGVLSAYARISLFFFPERQSGEFGSARAARLRELVGIDDSHPLANRALRNHWMHLDERLDRHASHGREVPLGYYWAGNPREKPPVGATVLRLIDPGKEVVEVLGERYSIRELTGAVEHVRHRIAVRLTGSASAASGE